MLWETLPDTLSSWNFGEYRCQKDGMDSERWSPYHHSMWENPLKARRGWPCFRGRVLWVFCHELMRIHDFTPWLLGDVGAWLGGTLTLLECEGKSSGLHPHWVLRVNLDHVGEKQKAQKNFYRLKWLLARVCMNFPSFIEVSLRMVLLCFSFSPCHNYPEFSGQGEMGVGKKWGRVDINRNYWNPNSLLEIKWYCFVKQQDSNNENHILHSGEFSWN